MRETAYENDGRRDIETFNRDQDNASAVHVRVPLLLRLLARKRVERGLSSARKHMKEEGENLKKILEAESERWYTGF